MVVYTTYYSENEMKNYLIIVGVAVALLSGCQSTGPDSIKEAQPEYNYALAETANEQMLLNLVRLKYRDTPYFLEVSGITESRSAKVSMGLGKTQWNVNAHNSGPTAVMAFPLLGTEETRTPTITYAPLQGEKFVKHLVSPIPLSIILTMVQAGWTIDRVFNLCVERINDLDNASTASGPTPETKPEYESFFRTTELLAKLDRSGEIEIGTKNNELVLKLSSSPYLASEKYELKNLLDLSLDTDEFTFGNNFIDSSDNTLTIRTRSIMEVLFYLSHAVTVSQNDINAGLVTLTYDDTGDIFDWTNNLSGELLKVHSSEEKPQGAFVSIKYRGSWFYINDNDLNSKTTFMLLNHLFNLQSGESKSIAPTLTLAVGS
ncbi:MAG: hypothetical protein LBB20_01285 [Puniceicoccales bacterium]|jgi:hypothetical protein|nr:hypothetical protein [Puniceicoccales bacterium]